MRDNVTYFDKEFGVTRVDLLEAMAMNRQLLQESNEKLLTRMDAEVKALRTEMNSDMKDVRNEIRRVYYSLIGVFSSIVIAVVVQLVIHTI